MALLVGVTKSILGFGNEDMAKSISYCVCYIVLIVEISQVLCTVSIGWGA